MKLTKYYFEYTCEFEGNEEKGSLEISFTDIPKIETPIQIQQARQGAAHWLNVNKYGNNATKFSLTIPFALREEEYEVKPEMKITKPPARKTAKRNAGKSRSIHKPRASKKARK